MDTRRAASQPTAGRAGGRAKLLRYALGLAGRLLVALAGVLWLLAPMVTVEGCLDPKGGTVELYDVHPRFKAAVEHGPVGETTQPAR